MNILDDPARIKEIDKEGMLEVEENFYLQLVEAKKIVQKTDLEKIKRGKFSGIDAKSLWSVPGASWRILPEATIEL